MNQAARRTGVWNAVLFALPGIMAITGMINVYLTDADIWTSLWPAGFHSHVVHGFGGTHQQDFTGNVHSAVSFGSTCWRMTMLLCLLAALQTLLDRCHLRIPGRIQPAAGNWRRSWLSHARRIGVVWLIAGIWLGLRIAAELLPASGIASFFWLSTAFWPAIIAAATLFVVPGRPIGSSMLSADTTAASPVRPILLPRPAFWLGFLTISWIAVSFWMNERLYSGLWIPHGDSAMYEEHLWNVWHGKGFRSYLDQGLFLGEHLQVIHLLLLPLHIIWPSHLMLELMESVALGICTIPIYRMALRYSGSQTAAAWLGATWLLFYPMHYLDIAIDLKTLRPGSFGLPFLFWGIDQAERHRIPSATICMVIALSAQEDFALISAGVGFVIWWLQRQRIAIDRQAQTTSRWGMALGLLSIVYVLAAVLWIIPAFRAGAPVHYSRYFGDLGSSPGDLVRTSLQDPLRVLGQLLTQRTLIYVLIFSVPLGFLPFRSPLRLLAGGGTFVMLSLIQLGSEGQGGGDLPPVPYHHFHAPLLPILFWAAAAGLEQRSSSLSVWICRRWGMTERQLTNKVARFACGCALFTAVTGSMMPIGAAFWSPDSRTSYWNLYIPGERARHFQKIVELLPAESRVASTDYVHTRLTHLERSYDYSDYLRAINNYQPGVPEDTDYIVIDTQHPYSFVRSPEQVRELREAPEKWELLPDRTDGYFIVLKRIRQPPQSLNIRH